VAEARKFYKATTTTNAEVLISGSVLTEELRFDTFRFRIPQDGSMFVVSA